MAKFKVTRIYIIEDWEIKTDNDAIEQVDIGADYQEEYVEKLED